ncbi:alpha/beta hydrolase [Lihuaxuella thermophila]|uniref:Lysophospholipase, alpha-beta hydrolase superfamily n=1 Tax=Lihuaxuella thermophila TaxID=1173111 RepID=A0A1H8BND7_9BACL|nr:alpha/beta hydrolase [Lihuaxuella thermophila]SEM84411.1 Lysophospholipase, alpha-beta hydrolase superfamily [Lihuaxuella thermophila]
MEPASFTFPSGDNTLIFVNKWTAVSEKPVGVVQIAHGMAEHSKRYGEFAKALTNEGYAVYANDHRGHGQTAGCKENLGFFADEDGWERVVDDMYRLTRIIKKEHPGLPVFLFGHSMGSFLSRRYIQKYGQELSGVILSGTGADQGILSSIGIGIVKLEMRIKGKKAPSRLLHFLSFGNFNKRFKPNRTPFDWLSRDEREVDKYIQDPYCGWLPTTGFFCDLLTGIKQLDHPEQISRVPKDLPIFLFSGDQDPVGLYTRGVLKTYRNLKKAGIRDISYKFYEEGRHEMLNEINRDEVYQDIINWLKARTPTSSS